MGLVKSGFTALNIIDINVEFLCRSLPRYDTSEEALLAEIEQEF